MINVKWGDAKAFCDWLSQKTAHSINLPTEAQWEKAARGTSQIRYPWGNTAPNCSKVNYSGCAGQTNTVGANPLGASYYGVQEMAGNVAEWCLDIFDREYYSISPYYNPVNATPNNPQGPMNYVIRGGSWESQPYDIRCTKRNSGRYSWGSNNINDAKSSTVGFRIVIER